MHKQMGVWIRVSAVRSCSSVRVRVCVRPAVCFGCDNINIILSVSARKHVTPRTEQLPDKAAHPCIECRRSAIFLLRIIRLLIVIVMIQTQAVCSASIVSKLRRGHVTHLDRRRNVVGERQRRRMGIHRSDAFALQPLSEHDRAADNIIRAHACAYEHTFACV